MNGAWVPHDTRDQIIDFVNHWTGPTELPARRLLGWIGLGTSKFHDWKHRYGKANAHNGKVPRDWRLHDWEKQAILDDHERHPLEGYRRLTFMMAELQGVHPGGGDHARTCEPARITRNPTASWSVGTAA